MVRTSELLDIDAKLGKERTKSVVDGVPVDHSVGVHSPVCVLDCSSDGKTLAVLTEANDLLVFDVQGLADKVTLAALELAVSMCIE